MTIMFYTALTLFVTVCVFLMMLILIQKGRGGGLSSAFGGGGGSGAFGAKTGDVLTWATSIVFGIFILLAIAMNKLSPYLERSSATNTVTPFNMPLNAPTNSPGPATQGS